MTGWEEPAFERVMPEDAVPVAEWNDDDYDGRGCAIGRLPGSRGYVAYEYSPCCSCSTATAEDSMMCCGNWPTYEDALRSITSYYAEHLPQTEPV